MNNSFECEEPDDTSLAVSAKGALERVCSGRGLDSPSRYYSQEFVDPYHHDPPKDIADQILS